MNNLHNQRLEQLSLQSFGRGRLSDTTITNIRKLWIQYVEYIFFIKTTYNRPVPNSCTIFTVDSSMITPVAKNGKMTQLMMTNSDHCFSPFSLRICDRGSQSKDMSDYNSRRSCMQTYPVHNSQISMLIGRKQFDGVHFL